MKLALAAILSLGLAAVPAALAEPGGEGEALYQARCNMCHGAGVGGAPLMEKLATLTSASIVEKLTTGTMAAMASGISDEDKKHIAEFVTKKAS
ncbi:MAG: cytochrome c [Alphaproteobacteria bacterium]|nr:cytochrome c [Alphaproteobacteria bacterium]